MNNFAIFKNEFGLIMVTAIIFTASFMWKDLFDDIEEMYFPRSHGLFSRFVFTLIISIFLIAIAIYLKNMLNVDDSKSITKDSKIKFDDNPLSDDSE
jgi:hypothetical protein